MNHEEMDARMNGMLENYRTRKANAIRETVFALADDMKLWVKNGFTHVSWYFNGSGDSGNIDECMLLKWKDMPKDEDAHDLYSFQSRGYDTSYVDVYYDSPVHKLCELLLDEHGGDWYNNDGGYGTVVMSLTSTDEYQAGYYWINMYIRVTEVIYEPWSDDLNKHFEQEQKKLD